MNNQEDKNMQKQGGCTCGAVRFSIKQSPMIVHACHCLDCQKASGAPFVVNMWIEDEHVELSGDAPKCFETTGGSGKSVEFYFCEQCGTTVWNRYHAAPLNTIWLRASCLDELGDIRPDMHIHTRQMQPWLTLSDGAPQFEGYYDMGTEWPAESLERFQKVLAAV
ncbi:GFA family protein [Aurantivibrio plasticivorans]